MAPRCEGHRLTTMTKTLNKSPFRITYSLLLVLSLLIDSIIYFRSGSSRCAFFNLSSTLDSHSLITMHTVGFRISALTCFILLHERYSIVQSNSCNNNAHLVPRTHRSFFLMVRANARQSVTTLNLIPNRYSELIYRFDNG